MKIPRKLGLSFLAINASAAVVMLVFSFILLLTINLLQAWTRKRAGKS